MSVVERSVTDLEILVLREQAHAVFKIRVEALPSSSFLAVSVAVIMHGQVSAAHLFTWLAAILAINGVQFALGLAYLANPERYFSPKTMLRYCTGQTLIASLIWCVVPLVFIDTHEASWAFVGVILCGLTAGSAIQGSAYAPPSIIFFTPILLAIIVKVLADHTSDAYTFGCDVALYLAFITRSCLAAQKLFRSRSLLKHQADSMAVSLKREHEAASLANARLFRLANHDSLTGLLNRAAFSAQLDARCRAAGDRTHPVSLLLLDLDGFKSVNDTLGHKAGDEVLQQVASRLSDLLGGQPCIARLGGDEFAILIDIDGGEAGQIARRIIEAVGRPIAIGQRSITVGVSIGLAAFPEDCTSTEDLRTRADLALYAAKDAGRNRLRRFESDLLARFEISRDVELDLPHALEEGAVEVWYQPQVDLADQALIGLEALIRWRHPKHGWISPPLIIETALRTRMSALVTHFVLDDACAKLRRLTDEGDDRIIVAVNISPAEIEHDALPDILERLIASHGIAAHRLELEITEDSLITSQSVIATLNRLSEMGIRLAIDDFGTGCSSIAYLRALKVDRIKIDRGFVTGFVEREGDRRLVQMILGMGKALDIEVIAEGVETRDEALLLRHLGCRMAQGYVFGRPMAWGALREWAREPSGLVTAA